jgi:PAS domain S-box-containing protein
MSGCDAVEALDESRRRLELAVEGAKLGTWTYDFRTGATWYSDRSKQMYGLPLDTEMSTEVIKAAVHPDHWEEVATPYLTGYIDDKVEVEYRVVWPNGAVHWVYSLGTATRDENGAAYMVNGIHLDITERKQAEARRQLDLAVQGAKLGNWTIDIRTRAALYSDRSRELYGIEGDDPLDVDTLRRYIHPEDWPRVVEPVELGFPSDTISIEHRVVRPSGEIRWVHSLGTALRDETGTVTNVTGIHLDITDRKRAEEELALSRDALHQSERLSAMGSLLAGVSHELNNPLAAIVGQAEMLEEDAQGTPLEARARKISSAAERCARIVQTFLAMARQKAPEKALINLNDVVASALDLTDYALRTAGVAVRVTLGSNLPPVEGDRDQLHQVLVNLIVNAKQAMEGGEQFDKTLTIRTSVSQSGAVLVDVCDTGPGVPEKARKRIFEPFFTTKPQGSGTGVGLSFSMGIIEAHRGTLSLEPSRRGAQFRITLPPGTETGIIAVPIDQTTSIRGGGLSALVVEDEPDVRETLRELLEREGFQVTVASDGAAALMALDRADFDLILSDLRMPGVSGPDLHARLTETKPHLIPRMGFVTGDTLGSSMDDFLRGCGRPILEKPFTKMGVRCLIASIAQPRIEP